MLPIQRKRMQSNRIIELAIDHLVNSFTENGALFQNTSASGTIDIQLPSATIEQNYKFRTTSANSIRILPESDEDIQPASSAVLTDGYAVVTLGTGNEYIEISCRSAGHWIVTASVGLVSGEAVVSNTEVAGVTAPVLGAEPALTVTADDHWTGVTTWSPTVATTFLAETVYTAIITLTPKIGYTLSGVTEDQFTVLGADTVTNPVNSGVVTAVFPATAAE